MKLDLLTNATVVNDAIRFVSDKSKKKLESSDEDDKESKQHDYDEDKDQLEIEQEEETGETTNQVFEIKNTILITRFGVSKNTTI
jgi:hypothetical protein